ncbi:MAG: hypothetical protein JNJ82_12550 [Opitutaceae bacterium]|nr:hypothetical protein [Opitutaceae bacterium]
MISAFSAILASAPPIPVPDSGATGVLLGTAVISVGLLARFLKNRKS